MFIAIATVGELLDRATFVLGTIEGDNYQKALETLKRMATEAGIRVQHGGDVLWIYRGRLELEEMPRPLDLSAFNAVKQHGEYLDVKSAELMKSFLQVVESSGTR